MTQRTSTPNMTSVRNLENPYLERVMRVIVTVVSVMMAVFIAGGLGGIVSESRTEVAQLQNGGLSRVNADIQEQLDGFVTDLLSLRNDPNLVALLDGTRNVQSASARAAEIMALESLQYVSIRYLRFNDAGDAVLDFGRFNNNGQISDVVTGTADDIYVPVPEAEIVFSAMVRGEITTPILSDFYVRDDGSNTIMIDSYVPVIRDGQVVRIINIEIDATTLRNTINLALGAQFDEQTGRRVLLIENNNNVIADSGAVGTAYIENLDAVGGNIAVSDYYRNVVSVDGILNGTSTPLGDIPNSLSIYSSQLVNYDLLPNLNWTIIVTDEVLSVYASSIRAITLLNVLVIFGGILVILFCRQAIAPVMNGIYEADTMMQTAALNSRTVVPASGSHSDLVNAARRVNNRLNKLNEDLEDVQNRRERDLQVAGRIGRETATLSDLKTLTNRSINLICNELGFYHAQIFLLDSSRTQAVLRYSRGEAGRALLEQGHQLAVGSDTVIGTVTAEGRPVIVNDTSSDSADGVHGFNRFLSETRAEMALPLMIGEQVLGALDIQSRRPFVFQEDDIPIYQLLADQLAVAIYNAQLREDAERRLERSQRQSQQYTRDAWQDTRNKLALSDKYGARLEDAKLSSDIRIRGEVIGSLEANLPDDMNFSEAEQQIIDAVADRVSLTLENVRLFQETQVTLRETSILYELSSQLNAADDLEDVLSAVIETIAADASGGQVWLFDETSFGRDPQWVQITDDIAISARPERVSLRGRRYQIVNYPFLQALTGDAPTIVQDVNDGTFVQDNLRNLFLSISGQALAIVPLSIRGIWRGFLSLTYAEPRTFGTQEQRLLQALITQAGVAVDNRLLYQQQENALVRQEKLYAASRIINTSQSLADLVYAAVATSSDPDLDFWLSLIEGNKDDIGWGDEARIVAKSEGGSISNTDEMHEILIPANSPMRQREPEILVDPGDAIEDVPTSVQWMRSLGYRFMAIFPLFSDNNPIALFYILNEDTYSLSQDDYDVYRALTGQMSTQIQNKNLLQQTEETLSEMRRLYAAARAINGARDLSQIYSTLAQHLTIHFQQRSGILSDDLHLAVTVLLAYPEPSIHAPQLRYEYQWYSDSKRKAPVPTGTIISQEDAPFGSLVMEDEDVVLLYDSPDAIPQDFSMIKDILTVHDARRAAVTPLWSRQRWLGVMLISTKKRNILNEDDRRFIQSIGDQLAIGIENQTLLAESQFERQRLQNILETLPVGVMVLDPDTLIPISANQQVEELLGQPLNMEEPFTAERYHIRRTGTNLEYPTNELPMYKAREQGKRIRPADDLAIITEFDRTDLLISAAPIFDPSGESRAIVVSLSDVTPMRSMENTMQENLRETVLLYETQRAMNESEDLEQLLDSLVAQMVMQQPTDTYIVLQNEGKIELARSMMMPIENIEALRPILLPELVNVDDVGRDTTALPYETRQAFIQVNARSVLAVPLAVRTRPEPMGWIIITDEAPEAFTFDQERTISSVADMASQAIDNRYLIERTQAALDETEALYTANEVISRARDVENLFTSVRMLLQDLQPDMMAGFILDGSTPRMMFDDGFDQVVGAEFDLMDAVTVALPEQDAVYVTDIDHGNDMPTEFEAVIQKAKNIFTVAAVNLRLQGEIGGRLVIGYLEPRRFLDSDRRYLGTIGDSTSVQADNQVLLETVQSSLAETQVLYRASKELIEVTEPDEILGVLTQNVIGTHVNQAFIAMLNRPNWDALEAGADVVATWRTGDSVDLNDITLTPEEFPAWRQLSSPIVMAINDVEDEHNDLDVLERMSVQSLDVQSFAVLPLRVPGRSIGVIFIGSEDTHEYSEREIRVLQAFAEQASLTLEAKRLLEQTEQRAKQLQTSAVISQSVSQILDLDELLPLVVDLIQRQFNYDHVQVFLMDENNEWADLKASTGEAGQNLLAVNHRLKRGSESVIGQVTELGEPTIALDTADAEVTHQPNPYLPETRSEMALPMVVKGAIVGALDVQSNTPNAFTDEDIQVLTTLASQIAVAIDNASLYEETERNAADMEFLFNITREAAAAPTLEDALQYVTERVQENIGGDLVAIYLPQAYEDYYGNRKVMVEIEAVTHDPEQMPIDSTPSVEVGDAENMIGMVTAGLQPQIIGNIDREVRYMPLSEKAKSALLMPITSRDEAVGLIVMESQRLNAFETEALTVLQPMAGSLAAVIQNTSLVEQLQTSVEQLREVDRLKSQFLASMSHELRTPLNSIIGFSRVMLKGIDGPLTEMQEQDLNTIYSSGNHLLRLINDILDQAKIEANELNLSFSYFEVKPMVESVKSIAVGLLKEKENLNMAVEVAPNLPKAFGDEMRSRQILLNVVTNAIKFTEAGQVTVRVYAVEGAEAPLIRMDVEDTGIGISEQDLPTVFEQFRQVDSSLTRTVGGTGLGLPISKSLAELQGGELTVQSEVNVGSIFSVTIPTVPGADEALERQLEEKRQAEKPVNTARTIDPNKSGLISKEDIEEAKRRALEGVPTAESNGKRETGDVNKIDTQEFQKQKVQVSGGRIDTNVTQNIPLMTQKRDVILVEDDKKMVDQFRRILQREGFDVTTADFPAFAEAMIGQLRPSLVILDVNFAEGKGWELLKNLKERDDTFDIPVVVTTIDDDSERAYQLGAHTFIQRPFLPDDLLESVLEAEKESQRERVVIIDDQPEAIRLLTQLLEEHSDFKIYSAQSGDEGISLVARRRPDLIILDLRMPDKDGFAVLDELRGNPETANIPVLVVTGEIDLSSNEQAQLADTRVLPKTDISQAEYDLFIDNVRAYLEKNQGR